MTDSDALLTRSEAMARSVYESLVRDLSNLALGNECDKPFMRHFAINLWDGPDGVHDASYELLLGQFGYETKYDSDGYILPEDGLKLARIGKYAIVQNMLCDKDKTGECVGPAYGVDIEVVERQVN